MRVLSVEARFQGTRPRWLQLATCLMFTLCAVVVPGCEEVARNPGQRPQTKALDQTGVSAGLDQNPRTPAHAPIPAKQSGPIIGQRTTDIRDASKEQKHAGAQVASPKIVAKDPITLQGNAYVSIIGQAAVGNMKHAMDLFFAENERYPKDYDEFMTVIVKPHGIALPQLPPYQKYGYDEKEHKLIVLEYPDLKK